MAHALYEGGKLVAQIPVRKWFSGDQQLFYDTYKQWQRQELRPIEVEGKEPATPQKDRNPWKGTNQEIYYHTGGPYYTKVDSWVYKIKTDPSPLAFEQVENSRKLLNHIVDTFENAFWKGDQQNFFYMVTVRCTKEARYDSISATSNGCRHVLKKLLGDDNRIHRSSIECNL